MKIYTYFEPDKALASMDFPKVLQLWEARWKKAGFEPVILNEDTARQHPKFDQVDAHVSQLPTINPKGYERACWLRWLAIEVVGGGLAVDSDVFPNPFCRPVDAGFFFDQTTILEPNGVPCAVWVDSTNWISENILGWNETIEEQGKPHTSDMVFFIKQTLPRRTLCVEFGETEWRYTPMIHAATNVLIPAGFNKASIESFLNTHLHV